MQPGIYVRSRVIAHQDLQEEVATFGDDSCVAMVDGMQEFDFRKQQIKRVECLLNQLG